MGAWDIRPFDNDGAMDLIAEIRNGDFSFEGTRWAFDDPNYLEVDGGQRAVALAALVRIIHQDPAAPASPLDADSLAAFAAQLTPESITWIHHELHRALSNREQSELFELWEESGSLDAWFAASFE